MKFLIIPLFLLSFTLHDKTVDNALPCICKLQHTFPTPPVSDQTLFYIQRTPNHNTIMYDLNMKKGKLDTEEPVHVYWIRYGENGQKEELSYIQRQFAYGLKTRKLADNRFELSFVSYKKQLLYLEWSALLNRYRIHTTINGKTIDVNKVFLQIEGGSFWVPNVVCVEVKGTDPTTGKEVVQLFKP
ncbi:DUF4833 domain-containing protein [Xanthocytophaga flava]|uniref:DUF4833 domain-containing protein n=1 Tax=Xanthocytophaga flava TaxID=3048013 RepID=UPI0028D87451|nr:DUF4833 domain-containing protein [Xanthocytophaga flavus]MDJ1471830.1 DUF4833 domain-containing protein [Xanthocytophaga flavus]